MTAPSYLCSLGLHWRCTGTCYPVGLPTRPCGCGLCHHKNAAPARTPATPPRPASARAGAAHTSGGSGMGKPLPPDLNP